KRGVETDRHISLQAGRDVTRSVKDANGVVGNEVGDFPKTNPPIIVGIMQVQIEARRQPAKHARGSDDGVQLGSRPKFAFDREFWTVPAIDVHILDVKAVQDISGIAGFNNLLNPVGIEAKREIGGDFDRSTNANAQWSKDGKGGAEWNFDIEF